MKKTIKQSVKYVFVTLLFYASLVSFVYLMLSQFNMFMKNDYIGFAALVGFIILAGIAYLLIKFSKTVLKLKVSVLVAFFILTFALLALGTHISIMSNYWSDYMRNPRCSSFPCIKMNFLEFYINFLEKTFD
ncbi:hypothetical protein KA012_02680 [Candidatus Woesebacteria bacterium]|nr:hypothetical protein [Candidatus Woesebacteria bacterium]